MFAVSKRFRAAGTTYRERAGNVGKSQAFLNILPASELVDETRVE